MSLHFRDALQTGHIQLNLEAASIEDAIARLTALLMGDPRILNFRDFQQAVSHGSAPLLRENNCTVCIAHARTDSVNNLVMAAGRLPASNSRPPAAPSSCGELPRLVFIAGIPLALNAEYLRLVGAIARICSSPESLAALLSAPNQNAFLETLESALNPI